MSYTCSLDGEVLTLHSVEFNPLGEPKEAYWYINIVDWTKSTTGVKDDMDRMLPMDKSAIAWCKEHYLPKVGIPLADDESTWREVFYGSV